MPRSSHRLFVLPLTVLLALTATAAWATSISVSASGANGVSTPPESSSAVPCDSANATTFLGSDTLSGGEFSALPGSFNLSLAVDESSGSLFPESDVTISNTRGSVPLLLSAGPCQGAPPLSVSGHFISGSGTWAVDSPSATGSYRQATGSGTFTIQHADLTPGTGRPWSISLTGSVDVLQPSLVVDVARSSWRHQSGDPSGRVATVVYRVSNEGPGDAFTGVFLEPDAPAGFDLLSIAPAAFGDVAADDSAEVTVRWVVGKLRGNDFDTTVHLQQADALDVGGTTDQAVHVTVPS